MIGIIDSGLGGLFVLNECVKICPNAHYLYFADNKNIPLGNKTKRKLNKLAKINCEKLIAMGCNIIVLACNTLTASSIGFCRKTFPKTIFIGIEPAVKPAIKTCEKALVLTTCATKKHSKLLKRFKNEKKLYFAPQKHLAWQIENNKKITFSNKLLKTKFDGCVLGCTHYNFIKETITKEFGINNFFEASPGVAKQLKRVLINEEEFKLEFIFSGKNETDKYKKMLEKLSS